MYFTRQEQFICLAVLLSLTVGSMLGYVFKKHPEILTLMNVADSDWVYPRIDVNQAGFEELDAIPYIGPYTANKILEYRQQHGRIHALDEIEHIKGIRLKNYEQFRNYLKVNAE